tara:strand:- start:219 stop:371 length:153 start_codon:yes stop_codon:yes gene_type:complete
VGEDIKRLMKGTLELLGFLINVTVITLAILPFFIVVIIPTYIMDLITRKK